MGLENASENLRSHLSLLEATATANIDGVTISDLRQPDAPLVYVNPGFEQMTGYSSEEVIGKNCRFLQGTERDETVLAEIRAALREERSCRVIIRNFRKDGTLFWNELTMYPLQDEHGQVTHFVGIQRDVTERKQLEAQFMRTQRMDSIGRLVGGIAHDLGNLLVPVLVGSRVLQKKYPDDEKTTRILTMIQESGERGAEMVKKVLSFARGVDGDRAAVDLRGVVEEVARLARETFPPDIELRTPAPEADLTVVGDATQLQQILLNLAVNARDAMPEGGILEITCDRTQVDTAMARMNLGAREGAFIRITVTDTGIGMPPDVLDKIYEPFFTTKPAGTGTGLGLSTVYNIARSHGGFVSAHSKVGKGTRIQVFLPEPTYPVQSAGIQKEPQWHSGAGKTVLVVDDESNIRHSLAAVLSEAGYEVLTAAGVAEARLVLDDHSVDVAIVDLMLGQDDGLDLIRELAARSDPFPVLAVSGMGAAKSEAATQAGARQFLSKPFTSGELFDALELTNPQE